MDSQKTGVKKPFRLEEIWRIRTRLELNNNLMELSLLNLAIDSKLRSSDLLSLRVSDISSNFLVFSRVQYVQKKTGNDVQFEVTQRTQQTLSHWIKDQDLKPTDYLFSSPRKVNQPLSYSYYRRIIRSWALALGHNPDLYGTHSLRRTKATLIYQKTKNIRAIQLLLGHTKIENTIKFCEVRAFSLSRLCPYPS
ncbi:tyrosine-type recombinase/integrase [Vibrio sp. IRLE0018]|uniref:tyrosine-type recombinase/integrase n=1 Tax=Vibrio TaxID=662 RepID=UPI001594E6A2|nr:MULTISPECIES: tyrosine-type recombinase/integrase [Vibrio]MCF8777720.1 tyrosine-type recombinase/integrase [Vibrio floridensis]NVC61708.1 integrase [Vibrio sp. 05-20-BW147]HAS6346870.1 tyrosine-type recombinase/integrase [Vibrio vulnificus]